MRGFESSPLNAELAQSALLANSWRGRPKLYARGQRRGLGVAIDVPLTALTADALAGSVMALIAEVETGAASRLRRAGSLRSLADVAAIAEQCEPLA